MADEASSLDESTNLANCPALGERVFCASKAPLLHHISLFVADMEASSRFYVEGVGLTRREDFVDIVGLRSGRRFPFSVGSVFLEAGAGRYIELHPAGGGDMSPPGFPMNHFAFAVADVDAAYEQALSAGGTAFDIPIPDEEWDGAPLDVIMSGPHPEPMRMAFLQGPSGELIELYQADDSTHSAMA